MFLAHVHPHDIHLAVQMRDIAHQVAKDYRLPLTEVEFIANAGGRGCEALGYCYMGMGKIQIVIRFRHPKTGEWMGRRPEADIWRTVAHELAHLEQARHGARHKQLTETLENDIRNRRFAPSSLRRLGNGR